MKKSKFKKFKQGIFSPKNKNKCLNKESAIYRSKLEMQFMHICDTQDAVKFWASERVIIPYFNSNKSRMARYFVDFYMETSDGQKFLIEIKPQKELNHVKDPASMKRGRKKDSTILYESAMATMNREKWQAAMKWCKDRNLQFMVITEEIISQLFPKKN